MFRNNSHTFRGGEEAGGMEVGSSGGRGAVRVDGGNLII